MRELSAEAEALWRAVELADIRRLGTPEVVALLTQLARVAPQGSDAWLHAHRELAALVLEEDPWGASCYARRAVAENPRDALSWGTLGVAQSMLGHHRYALRAYRRALHLDPANPWLLHNVGHLLDVGFDRPADGAAFLTRAYDVLHEWPRASRSHVIEIRASLAHALGRAGQVAAAHAHMRAVVQSGHATSAHHELYRMLRDLLEDSLAEEIRRLATREMSSDAAGRRVRRRRETGDRPRSD